MTNSTPLGHFASRIWQTSDQSLSIFLVQRMAKTRHQAGKSDGDKLVQVLIVYRFARD